MRFAEYDYVRIVRLRRAPEEYDDFDANDHAPQMGEEGIIIDVDLRGDGLVIYTVEGHAVGGAILWIAAFVEDELEPSDMEPASSSELQENGDQESIEVDETRPTGPRRKLIGSLLLLVFFLAAVTAWVFLR